MAGKKENAIIESDSLEHGFNLGSTRPPDELREAGIDVDDIEIVTEVKARDKIAEARFMEEKVVIEIEADDDPNAPEFIYTGHQGVTQYIMRGKPQAIKRKYLYSLLAAKTVKMAAAFGKDGNGNEFNRLTPSGRMTHRVRLIRDDNPLGGMQWFMKAAQGTV